jgi:ADP-ribose pyrophosphatase YjhB (NUDIX family)
MSVEITTCPNCGQVVEKYRNPFPTVDVIVNIDGRILLIKRKNEPHGWAIPGGFIDYGESAEEAARREIKEETNLDIDDIELLGVYSDPERDPRFHTLSVVYMANSKEKPRAGDDAGETGLFLPDELPEDEIVFDHNSILRDYMQRCDINIH